MLNRSRPLLLSLALSLVPALAGAQNVPIPEEVFRYVPAATVFGPEATWVNPSALGRFKPSALEVMADLENGSFARNWGAVTTNAGIGLGLRSIHVPNGDDLREYIIAGGIPLGEMISIGGSYRHFPKGPDPYNERHYWNLSLTNRGTGPLAFAGVWSNLNRSEDDGEKTDIQQRYSIAYRPQGNVLTLAVDALSATVRDPDDWTYVYHAELTPMKGIFVEGFLDSESNFEIGLRVNLLNYFVGSQSHFDDGADHRLTHFYVGRTAARQESLLKERGKRVQIGMTGRPAENPVQPVFGRGRLSYADLILGLYRAAEDPTIAEMILTLDNVRLSLAQAQELRDAMQLFRSQNKTIVCHVANPTNISYYLATAADSILMPPVSQLELIGLRAELTFYAGTMDKLGIEADMMRIGEYKTAAEAFTRESASEENRAMTNRLLDDLYEQFVDGIAEGRGISTDSVRAIINRGPFTSEEALALGLVDGLSYRDRMVDDKFLRRMPEISFSRYRADTLLNDGWPRLPEIAVVVAEGEIAGAPIDRDPWDQDEDAVTPGLMKRAFQSVKMNPRARGVVFRVDSPGGWALAGEEIFHEARQVSQRLPMVVSMSGLAASGGYYISMAAKRLFADPATITGSIGIYGGKPVLAGLYEKINLGKELYTRGDHAGMMTWTRPFTDDERERYFDQLRAFYNHFISLVGENRGLETDSVDNIGRGRVWTGREALANGLVDSLGGLREAITYTAEAAGLDDYRVVRYPQRTVLFRMPRIPLLGSFNRWLGLSDATSSPVPGIIEHLPESDLLARLPYDIDIR